MRWPAEMVCGLKGMDNLWGGGEIAHIRINLVTRFPVGWLVGMVYGRGKIDNWGEGRLIFI